MDTFDTTMMNLTKLSSIDRRKSINDLKGECSCPACPTYTECAKEAREVLFCVTGRSFHCISVDKGCICQTKCPLAKQVGLTHKDFCLKGSESAQRYINGIH